jgi:hypothetical protein
MRQLLAILPAAVITFALSLQATPPDMVVKVELPTQGGLPQWAVIILQGSVGALVGSCITLFGVWLTSGNTRRENAANRSHDMDKLRWQWRQETRKEILIPLMQVADQLRIRTPGVRSHDAEQRAEFLRLSAQFSQHKALASLVLSDTCMQALDSIPAALKGAIQPNLGAEEQLAAIALLRSSLATFVKAVRTELGIS